MKMKPITPELFSALNEVNASAERWNELHPICDAYRRKALAERVYMPDPKWSEEWPGDDAPPVEMTSRITDPKNAWLLSDSDAKELFARFDELKAEAGFTGYAPGVAPDLVANTAYLNARRRALAAAEYITGIDGDAFVINGHGDEAISLLFKLAFIREVKPVPHEI